MLVAPDLSNGSLGHLEFGGITTKFPDTKFVIFGIEHYQKCLDLNESFSAREKFDLGLDCNELEHVHHRENFERKLPSLLKKSGTLWSENSFTDIYRQSLNSHYVGSYPSDKSKLLKFDTSIIDEFKSIFSKSLYLFHHLLMGWTGEFGFRHPLVAQIIGALSFHGKPLPSIANLYLHRFLVCVHLSSMPKTLNSDPLFGCRTLVRAKKVLTTSITEKIDTVVHE